MWGGVHNLIVYFTRKVCCTLCVLAIGSDNGHGEVNRFGVIPVMSGDVHIVYQNGPLTAVVEAARKGSKL